MTVQEQIEQLRVDIAAIEAAKKLFERNGLTWFVLKAELDGLRNKLADLEAQAAEDDKWRYARAGIVEIQSRPHIFAYSTNVLAYIQHLIDENKRLEAELAKRPVVYVLRHRHTGHLKLYQSVSGGFPALLTASEVDDLKAREGFAAFNADYEIEPYTGQKS
jgi:hypothetical protein